MSAFGKNEGIFVSMIRRLEKDNILLIITAIIGVVAPGFVYLLYQKIHSMYYFIYEKTSRKRNNAEIRVRIFYASQTGTSEDLADRLAENMRNQHVCAEISNLAIMDPDEFLNLEGTCLFLLSTSIHGSFPKNTEWFFEWLNDVIGDFRVGKSVLSRMCFGIFGLGNSKYGPSYYNKAAKLLSKKLHSLGGFPLCPIVFADERKAISMEEQLDDWSKKLLSALLQLRLDDMSLNRAANKSNKKNHEEEKMLVESASDTENDDIADMEDMDGVIESDKKSSNGKGNSKQLPEMLTPIIRQSLTKQGYKLIGDHSGVKLCRWTKAMIRGRGGCYKHAFYGIASHQCMEATPSLACANKCIFCWRHHTNPVGTEWKWTMNDPEYILDTALSHHGKLVRQLGGVPDALPRRLAEAQRVRHCALSLVGEPIMYPRINELIDLLHRKSISTFLVTNAQFPDLISRLRPVTQLYVSVDAPTKEALKKIDRPLFGDFWQRFTDSLKQLSIKGQRTVYRLTLVKGFNTSDLEKYAELVAMGLPDFIELKGVTYCGDSRSTRSNKLTMKNVPWHEEVVDFARRLALLLGDNYQVAGEHEHSNCVLIASSKFNVDGHWHTWIDYDEFHRRIAANLTIKAVDYMAETPDWAVFGAEQRGFNPMEKRWFRKNKAAKDIFGC